ncbi:MAG: hypothetical protein M3Q07_02845 [Pseudobdellovibrionaceae bacterium]|nr:hypothetical protein [Pseudobdellovibrionaceae bacterium]
MKRILFFLMLAAGPLQAQSEGWSCSSASLPQECTGSAVDGSSEAAEHACLLRLYGCGKYEQVIHRVGSAERGLNKIQNYFAGVSYFGLLNRVRAQSLRCYYIKAAKQQLEEFMDAVQTVCTDPSDAKTCSRNPVSYGSDRDIDMIYHASRVQDVLKKEARCAESAHTEASIYRYGKLYTNDVFRSSVHGVATGSDAVTQSLNQGLKGVQESLNLFVTEASKLESRYTQYSILMDQAGKDLGEISLFLRDTALSPEIVAVEEKNGLSHITIDDSKLGTYLDGFDAQLQNSGAIPVRSAEQRLEQYFQKNTVYYSDIRNDNLKRVDDYLIRSALFNNLFRLDGDVKEKLKQAQGSTAGSSQTLTSFQQALNEYKTAFKGKDEPCTLVFHKTKWHCLN